MMSNLKELNDAIALIESYGYTVNSCRIDEGIDIDRDRKIISFTKKHELNVDTSVENNPSFDISTVDGVEICTSVTSTAWTRIMTSNPAASGIAPHWMR